MCALNKFKAILDLPLDPCKEEFIYVLPDMDNFVIDIDEVRHGRYDLLDENSFDIEE